MGRAGIPFLTVAGLGELIRTGEVSPVEAAEAYLHRIESLNGDIRAYLTVTAEQARQAAHEAEAEISGGQYRGPLHGVPVAGGGGIWSYAMITRERKAREAAEKQLAEEREKAAQQLAEEREKAAQQLAEERAQAAEERRRLHSHIEQLTQRLNGGNGAGSQ